MRAAWGRMPSMNMGGEYPEPTREDEVEIARIPLASTTGDQVSVRTRQRATDISHSIVGGYPDRVPYTTRLPNTRKERRGAMDYELLVDGQHLREGAKIFKLRRKVRASDKATVGFADGNAVIGALERGFVARATGLWPGVAETSAAIWVALGKCPPTGDEIHICYSEGRLKIGNITIHATWLPISATLLAAPAAPDWVSALGLKHRVPPPEAVALGYTGQIAEAERKLSLLLARTAKSLSALGITEEDLHALVRRRLTERWGLEPLKQVPPNGNEPGDTGGMN